MGALLGRLIAAQRAEQAATHGIPLGYLAQLLRAFGGQDAVEGSGRDAAAAVPGLAEQLTARELQILVLLAAGTPNPRIAAERVVSLDTVKSTSATCWASWSGQPRRGGHPGPRARPDPLARHPQLIPGRHCRATGRPGGTVMRRGRLQKIPPPWAPSGDAHSKRRLVPSWQN
jgi:hypothetical protein